MTAENRKQIGFRVKEIFGSLLNLANTEFEGKSIFAGHKYDSNAFEEGLALTTWDKDWQSVTDGNGVEWKPPQYVIEGASESSMMIQFTSDGEVGVDALNYRWSKDGGKTWNDATLAAGDSTLIADGVRVTLPPKSVNNATVPATVTGLTVKAAGHHAGSGRGKRNPALYPAYGCLSGRRQGSAAGNDDHGRPAGPGGSGRRGL